MKEKLTFLLTGEVTIAKKDFWMTVVICTLLGVLIGLINAPFTHGFTFSCGNIKGNAYYGKGNKPENELKDKQCEGKGKRNKKGRQE